MTKDMDKPNKTNKSIDDKLGANTNANLVIDAGTEDDNSLISAAEAISEVAGDSESQLEQIARAMEIEHDRNLQELEGGTNADDASEEAVELLKKQIEEDEELRKEEARLAERSKDDDVDLGELDLVEVQSCVEALLFVSDKPLSIAKLRGFLGADVKLKVLKEALANMQSDYAEARHGVELAEISGGYQLRTKPSRAPVLKKLSKVQTQRLSRGCMESLAIIAYKQPAMKEQIDSIRGVDSSHFIRILMEKKLISISGRSELPGRPILYSTTPNFLEIFGLKDTQSLPPLKELESMIPSSEAGGEEKEDPRILEIRKMVDKLQSNRSDMTYDPKEDASILDDIRTKVKSIPISTPYLDEQKAAEKAAKIAAEEEKQAKKEAKAAAKKAKAEGIEVSDFPDDSTEELAASGATSIDREAAPATEDSHGFSQELEEFNPETGLETEPKTKIDSPPDVNQ